MIKKYVKAGLLIVTLVIPALVFGFLRFFTTNHYNIPYFHPVKNAAGQIKVERGDTVFYALPDIGGYKFRDKLTVISYFEPNCVDSCEVMHDNLDRIYGLTEGIKDLNVMLVSDTIVDASVRGWKDGWRSVKLVDGDRTSVLLWDYQDPGKTVVGDRDNRWILIDKEGRIRGYYNGASHDETDRLMAEIKILDLGEKRGLVK
ncbi:hypothetical protein DSL64_16520 [Dyadobacter luteus]|uniref:SCO family protein n=1 Tax=Dyadobacter luteus TaxID=2259619 RepID=A0A3D8YA91_9BACT|nr:hypothetical protein [Dyadobacter luteus]REA59910.1 hypothetical protein DSL64_16520 [Dyadobacter luteus]